MRKIWKGIGIILALIAIYYAAQIFIGGIIGVIQAIPIMAREISSGDYPDIVRITEELIRAVSPLSPVITILSVAVTVPFYFLIYRNRKQDRLAFVSVRGIGAVSIPVLVIFAVSMNFLIDWLLSLASQVRFLSPLFERYDQLAQYITGGSFVLSLLAVGIIGPIFEEILFRGLIFGELRKITTVRAALFIQAALFGICHFNVIQSSYAFVIGILIGFVYYRSNSIIAPMIVHIAINSSTVILGQLLPGNELEQWTGAVVAAAALLFVAAGAFLLISRRFRRTMDNSLYYMNQAPIPDPPSGTVM
jgi:membrane protease YdiL (CAAX protease family)